MMIFRPFVDMIVYKKETITWQAVIQLTILSMIRRIQLTIHSVLSTIR